MLDEILVSIIGYNSQELETAASQATFFIVQMRLGTTFWKQAKFYTCSGVVFVDADCSALNVLMFVQPIPKLATKDTQPAPTLKYCAKKLVISNKQITRISREFDLQIFWSAQDYNPTPLPVSHLRRPML